MIGYENIRKKLAAAQAARLLGSYPPQEAGDPEIVTTHIVELFCRYPQDRVDRAVTRLVEENEFLPRIAKIKAAIEEETSDLRRQQEREARPLMLPEPAVDRSKRKTYEELQEICARDGLLIGKEPPQNKEKAAREFMQKNGVSQEVFDMIPNAPAARSWDKMR